MIEEFFTKMHDAALKVAKDASDRLSIAVARGITHVDYVIAMGNRVLSVSEKQVKNAYDRKQLDEFCRHVANRLRGKSFVRIDNSPYMRQDLIREKYFFLEDLLRDLLGSRAARKLINKAIAATTDDANGEKLSTVAEYNRRLFHLRNLTEEILCQKIKTKNISSH